MKISIKEFLSESAKRLEKGFVYGLRLRPYSIGAQPDNPIQFISPEELPFDIKRKYKEPDYRFGVLVYKNKLSDRDVEHFSLTDMNVPSPAEQWELFKDFVEDMIEREIDFDEFVESFIKPRAEYAHLNPLSHLKPAELFSLLQKNGYPGRLKGLEKMYNEI